MKNCRYLPINKTVAALSFLLIFLSTLVSPSAFSSVSSLASFSSVSSQASPVSALTSPVSSVAGFSSVSSLASPVSALTSPVFSEAGFSSVSSLASPVSALTSPVFSEAGFSSVSSQASPVSSEAVLTYALIKNEITLYSDSILSSALTSLPATYFVVLLEADPLYLKVGYMDLVGFVLPSEVEIVDYEPVTKFASSFGYSVSNDGYPATLRSSPDHLASNKILEIPAGSSGVYYGTILGSSMLLEVGNLWYYLSFNDTKGYVYKSQISVQQITPNVIEKVLPPASTQPPKSPFEMEDSYTLLIIAALTLPAIFISLIIFKKPTPTPRWNNKKDQ